MSECYEEIIEGESMLRQAPGTRHETLCSRLHAQVAPHLVSPPTSRLLPPRFIVQLSPGTLLRPDLTLLSLPGGKPWLIVEIINAQDHRPDTVVKKRLYEEANLPRLWVVDPRYDNVEIYHGSSYGLALLTILSNRQYLTETLLPGFRLPLRDFFEE